MKKILLLPLLVAQQNFCNAQQNSNNEIEVNEKSIARKWVLDDIINPEKTSEEIAELKDMLSYVWLDFKEDKTYAKDFIIVVQGTWKLDTGKKIISTADTKGNDTWKIHSLTKNTLTLSLNDSTQKIVFKAK